MKKAYYSFPEICELLQLKPHTIRYWETEFTKLNKKPGKGASRLYSVNDLELLKNIKELIYVQKFTLAGAKKEIKNRKKQNLSENLNVNFDLRKELIEIRDILIHRKK